eukprot:2197624-Rhodomonas_salina.1
MASAWYQPAAATDTPASATPGIHAPSSADPTFSPRPNWPYTLYPKLHSRPSSVSTCPKHHPFRRLGQRREACRSAKRVCGQTRLLCRPPHASTARRLPRRSLGSIC